MPCAAQQVFNTKREWELANPTLASHSRQGGIPVASTSARIEGFIDIIPSSADRADGRYVTAFGLGAELCPALLALCSLTDVQVRSQLLRPTVADSRR